MIEGSQRVVVREYEREGGGKRGREGGERERERKRGGGGGGGREKEREISKDSVTQSPRSVPQKNHRTGFYLNELMGATVYILTYGCKRCARGERQRQYRLPHRGPFQTVNYPPGCFTVIQVSYPLTRLTPPRIQTARHSRVAVASARVRKQRDAISSEIGHLLCTTEHSRVGRRRHAGTTAVNAKSEHSSGQMPGPAGGPRGPPAPPRSWPAGHRGRR